ncbi:hypothetical protein PGT21_035578 [Puccinia graminis f. sp. tritici]|uniref:Tubulin-tyrosine ligase n=1 Tax=Puccinia graminis f. sp. tritici TaxID=56615 RepID=A0A5B0NQG7_PUCGR|nr:hypothetical protein PGTUg99_036909 [Puccinia graminis f. sp. tritici]KAA1091557.1 hypothetical protein PGT21_035578 [Puccinia graminis f. sp. tritici]
MATEKSDGEREEPDYPFRAGHITVSYPPGPANEYTLGCLLPAIEHGLPEWTILVDHKTSDLGPAGRLGSVQWSDYDHIEWAALKAFPHQTLFNAYPIRKALIRKNYLIKAVEAYAVKNKLGQDDDAGLQAIPIPKSYPFTLSFSDELDELWADELYELAGELSSNELSDNNDPHPIKLWILKPALADKAQGIRLFRSREELYEIFSEFERLEELLEEQSQEPDDQQQADQEAKVEQHQTWVSVSQMRDWIIQEYISNPLLIDPAKPETYSTDSSLDRSSFHKHHLRVYVLAVGALSVYVYEDILSLFSSKAYTLDDLNDLGVHLTNTCLQESLSGGGGGGSTGERPQVTVSIANHPVQVLDQIDAILANLFGFVAQNDPINFQLNPNCFEIFGIDFLVDHNLKVWLLEINAGPDFGQTGQDLKPTIEKLFTSTINVLKSEISLLRERPTTADHESRKATDPSPPRPAPSNTKTDACHRSNIPPRLRYPQHFLPFRKVLELQTNVSFR